MASIKKKLEKNGNVVYQVQASNGRGRRVWRTFRPEPTWSSRTVQRELQRFAAELESQLEDREVLTREETIQQAFNVEAKDNACFLPKILSRKKQVVPMLSLLWG